MTSKSPAFCTALSKYSSTTAQAYVVLERLRQQYPDSPHLVEAEFRLAERDFIDADYRRAEVAYARVIDRGEDTAYYTRALYMRGWSRFKLGAYRQSVEPFTATLDQLLQPLEEGAGPESLPLFR